MTYSVGAAILNKQRQAIIILEIKKQAV